MMEKYEMGGKNYILMLLHFASKNVPLRCFVFAHKTFMFSHKIFVFVPPRNFTFVWKSIEIFFSLQLLLRFCKFSGVAQKH